MLRIGDVVCGVADDGVGMIPGELPPQQPDSTCMVCRRHKNYSIGFRGLELTGNSSQFGRGIGLVPIENAHDRARDVHALKEIAAIVVFFARREPYFPGVPALEKTCRRLAPKFGISTEDDGSLAGREIVLDGE